MWKTQCGRKRIKNIKTNVININVINFEIIYLYLLDKNIRRYKYIM